MLQPAKQKFRKQHKGRNTGIATTGNKVSFGEFGLKAVTRGRITARQIEAARRVMTRHIKGAVESGLECFQINLSLKNQLKFVWVKVKEVLNTMWLKLNLEKCYTRWMEYRRISA